jgi:Fibronectin type III domain
MVRRCTTAAALAALTLLTASSTASFAKGPGSSAPNPPTSLTLSSGNRTLTASWAESTSGRITFTATATAAGEPSRACQSKTLTCKVPSLVNGVVYDVTVIARDTSGASAPSGAASVLIGVPGAPLSVHATRGHATAVIAWSPPKASGVTSISSYAATAFPGGFSCSTAKTILEPPARTCEIPGLTIGVAYSVTVTATNSFGTGVPSRAVTVTPS